MKWLIACAALIGVASIVSVIVIGVRASEPTVVADPYETGLKWDAERKSKTEAGWRVRIDTPQIRTGVSDIIVSVLDRLGGRLSGADVRLRLDRARFVSQIHEYHMNPLPDGRYRASVDLALAGRWDVTITVRRGTQQISYNETLFAEGAEQTGAVSVR